MEIKFLGRKIEPVCNKVIVFSKDSAPKIKSTAEKRMEKLVNSHKCEKCIVSTRFYSESI